MVLLTQIELTKLKIENVYLLNIYFVNNEMKMKNKIPRFRNRTESHRSIVVSISLTYKCLPSWRCTIKRVYIKLV